MKQREPLSTSDFKNISLFTFREGKYLVIILETQWNCFADFGFLKKFEKKIFIARKKFHYRTIVIKAGPCTFFIVPSVASS